MNQFDIKVIPRSSLSQFLHIHRSNIILEIKLSLIYIIKNQSCHLLLEIPHPLMIQLKYSI